MKYKYEDFNDYTLEESLEILREEICDFINNTENEDYIKLTDEEIDNLAEKIVDNVLQDNELNRVLTDTIEWYVNKELYKEEE